MAMTPLLLVFMGSLGVFFAILAFLNVDRWTQAIGALLAAFAWGAMGLSANSVRIPSTTTAGAHVDAAIQPFVPLGIGLGVTMGIVCVWRLFQGMGDAADDVDATDPLSR